MASHVAHVQLVHAQAQAGDKLRLRTWIEFQLLRADDTPAAGEEYRVRLPGGAIRTGALDQNGVVRIDDIPSGVCEICFPKLDQDLWMPLEPE
jgi:type VI secretion system secreted protein VgrG